MHVDATPAPLPQVVDNKTRRADIEAKFVELTERDDIGVRRRFRADTLRIITPEIIVRLHASKKTYRNTTKTKLTARNQGQCCASSGRKSN